VRIAGYVDGDIDASGLGCGASFGTPRQWDGYWFNGTTSQCSWNPKNDGGLSAERIDAPHGNIGLDQGNSILFLDTSNPTPRWTMIVKCFGQHNLWTGYKYTGNTPAGTYIRASGNETTTAFVVSVV
jgi:hypothetical protein